MALRGFASFAISKVTGTIITLFAIICVNFMLFRLLPGDPIRMMFKDPRVPAKAWELARERFGLDKPLWEQFFCYLRELSRGNLGVSFWQKKPVLEVIADRLPQTLLLLLTALFMAVVIGTMLGAIAGWKSGTKRDAVILFTSLGLWALPGFCVAMILLLLFAIKLAIFPLGGVSTPGLGLTGFAYWVDVLRHMFLPGSSLAIWYMGEYVILMRSSMVDVLGEDYITTARAKGLKESVVLRKHGLRNALLPVVTMTGINVAYAVGGVVPIETVFGWPGVGKLLYDAVMGRDHPLLQGAFLVLAVAVVLANLVTDLIYGYIDPRIKVGKSE